MYLLSSLAIKTVEDGWEMVHSYMHRYGSPPGQIEQAFRVGKAELGMESPRLWFCRAADAGKQAEALGYCGLSV